MATSRKTADGRHTLRPGEYQRKSGTFEYKPTINGRVYTVSAKTLEELRRKEDELKRQVYDGVKPTGSRISLNDFYSVWKKNKRGLKTNTFSNYCYMYEKFCRDTIGKKRVKDIVHSDIKSFYNKLSDKGIQINSLEVIQNVIHQILDICIKDDIIRRNPADNALKELKREFTPAKRKALTIAEQVRFLEVIRGTIWEPVFSILLYCGLRVGEIAGLVWEDIDDKQNVIHVQRNLIYYKDEATGKCLKKINTTKSVAGARDLPLTDEIKRLLEIQRTKGNKCTETVDGVDNFIFANRYGETIHQSILNRALKRIITDANNQQKENGVLLPDFSCHVLRHTYATNLARAGADVTSLMGLMGHRDVQTTMNIYTEAQQDMKEAAEEQRQKYTAEAFAKLAKEIAKSSTPKTEGSGDNCEP